MKHLFVPYDIAVKLKEKGYEDNIGLAFYQDGELKISEAWGNHIKAPLWQQAIDWLREEKGALVCIEIGEISCIAFVKYKGEIHWIGDDIYSIKCYDTYYSALQSGIEKALELINH